MSELVADCPRCRAKRITLDLLQQNLIYIEYGWMRYFEAFCVCRHCRKSTVFVVRQKEANHSQTIEKQTLAALQPSVNRFFDVHDYLSLKDFASIPPPDHLPDDIRLAFEEGAKCLAVGCHNAAATMFRLCVDIATRSMLPGQPTHGLSHRIRRNLGLRLGWLFDNQHLPESLRDLSTCIREDGNDGAHAGTLSKDEAEDVCDFTVALLERLYTEPERLRLARDRRDNRRATT